MNGRVEGIAGRETRIRLGLETVALLSPGCLRVPRSSAGARSSLRHDSSMDTTWSVTELMDQLERFEQQARAAGLKEASVRTYVDRSRIFVRWLAGDYQFQGPR